MEYLAHKKLRKILKKIDKICVRVDKKVFKQANSDEKFDMSDMSDLIDVAYTRREIMAQKVKKYNKGSDEWGVDLNLNIYLNGVLTNPRFAKQKQN